ncbi:MAG: anaerobic ribonucleoside-triphosphate reductase activating protein [Bacteroidales bacterium]|jgi:pyruvate formate lyase activating enzyme|nr:anaerobic ribonucleoside-triphosphate reductase activating protein [Bacteroidales bacterium]
MRIGGFTKQSFIDWDGKTVAVIFTKGCNFRCGYCHNPSLVLPKLLNIQPDIPEKTILNYLAERKEWLDGVVVTGGEPTIHKDLDRFLHVIKETGMPVKLDTNGSHPEVLQELIGKKLVDYVAMDIKTILEAPEYMAITGNKDAYLTEKVTRSLHILRDSEIAYQLRTTILPEFHQQETILALKNNYAADDHVFQKYRDGMVIERVFG